MTQEIQSAEVLNLVDHVEYAQGAVVSKTLIEKIGGTLTLFAFDKGEGLSEHSSPFDALVQVLDGEVEITIGGKSFKVVTGQIALMPAHAPHSLQSITRFKMLLTMIRSK
ncbi:MAG: cupin domain-containing protein [Chloroflexota bacterium]|nr:cupin domain-containing protein [Chloroflexota bacterium]